MTKKKTNAELQAFSTIKRQALYASYAATAAAKGGQLLSKEYTKSSEKHEWMCKFGHVWRAVPPTIQRGGWCPICSGRQITDALQKLKVLAAGKGGECLSTMYINGLTNMDWKCKLGHVWSARASHVMHGSWCPKCSIEKRGLKKLNKDHNFSTLQKIALAKGGLCLSTEYKGIHEKLEWQCKNGHIWMTMPATIKKGSWCSVCCGKRIQKPFEFFSNLAKDRKGLLLTPNYLGVQKNHKWQCEKGHTWLASPENIRAGAWCHYCSGHKIENPLKRLENLAILKKGKLLSSAYVGTDAKYTWECEKGHNWEARGSSIKRGGWCPICVSGINERLVRYFTEQLFSRPFPKIKPDWLVNPNSKRRLELDCYNEELKIAVEYQGVQHYSLRSAFKMTAAILEASKDRDAVKRKLCDAHNVTLIEIPYTLKSNDFAQYLYTAIGGKRPELISSMKKCCDIDMTTWISSDAITIEQLNKHAESQGGKCLSSSYLGANVKHEWQCIKGHTWFATSSSVTAQKTWCPNCSGNVKLTIEEMSDKAKHLGGELLSTVYIKNNSPLEWKCKNGHLFKLEAARIRRGDWCRECKGPRKTTIEDLHRIAQRNGGLCRSTIYLTQKDKYDFECEKGHTWTISAHSMLLGSWCRKCKNQMHVPEKGSLFTSLIDAVS